jgi:hypothetical protein
MVLDGRVPARHTVVAPPLSARCRARRGLQACRRDGTAAVPAFFDNVVCCTDHGVHAPQGRRATTARREPAKPHTLSASAASGSSPERIGRACLAALRAPRHATRPITKGIEHTALEPQSIQNQNRFLTAE